MKDIDYGISNVYFGADAITSKTVKFGDGNTLISGVSFGDYGCGICLVRNKSESHYPFASYKNGELNSHVNESPLDEKVYLLFDNVKSIEALICQLSIQMKHFMQDDSGESK